MQYPLEIESFLLIAIGEYTGDVSEAVTLVQFFGDAG